MNAITTAATTTRTSEPAPSHSRRGLLRFAVGAVAAAGLAATGLDRTAAKDRQRAEELPIERGGKRRPAKPGVCRPGTVLARLTIPADGTRIETTVLEKGKTYRLRASGFVGLANRDGGPAFGLPAVDADYGFFRQGAPRPNDRVGGLDWGLAIDGKAPSWGAFAEDHDYQIPVVGRGKRLALALVYGDEFAADGQGTMTLEIECA